MSEGKNRPQFKFWCKFRGNSCVDEALDQVAENFLPWIWTIRFHIINNSTGKNILIFQFWPLDCQGYPVSGRAWLDFRKMLFPRGNWNSSPGNGQVPELEEFGQWPRAEEGILGLSRSWIPVIPFQLRVFHELLQVVPGAASREKPSKTQPPLGCGHTLGQGKPLLPLEKPMAQPRSASRNTKSRKITWFHSFLHVWTRIF